MTFFTTKMLQEYVAPLNRLIEMQAKIIEKKELEVIQLAFEVNQLKEQLALTSNTTQDPELKPISTGHEPWTLRRQRLEREDRQSPEAVAERMRLENYWKKRNEVINAVEERNA